MCLDVSYEWCYLVRCNYTEVVSCQPDVMRSLCGIYKENYFEIPFYLYR